MFFVFIALFLSGSNAAHARVTCPKEGNTCRFTVASPVAAADRAKGELVMAGGKCQITEWAPKGRSGSCTR